MTWVSPGLIASASSGASRSNEQLQLLVQGWVAIAMLAGIGALGLAIIAVLLAVWRRSLARQHQLEVEVKEMRQSLSALGDAWAASATRIPGFSTQLTNDAVDDDDEEEDEEDDPYNLFGGRDPLERDGFSDDDEEEFDDEEDSDRPPPGF